MFRRSLSLGSKLVDADFNLVLWGRGPVLCRTYALLLPASCGIVILLLPAMWISDWALESLQKHLWAYYYTVRGYVHRKFFPASSSCSPSGVCQVASVIAWWSWSGRPPQLVDTQISAGSSADDQSSPPLCFRILLFFLSSELKNIISELRPQQLENFYIIS